MHTGQLKNFEVNSCFANIEVTCTTYENIAFLNFKNKKNGENFAEAILLPQGSNVRIDFNPNSYTYPIFLPDGMVEVDVSWQTDTIKGRRLMCAVITCTSNIGEQTRAIHYLTDIK